MKEFHTNEHPHRRYNPLLDEWILVSPHRNKRPWQGQKEAVVIDERPEYDPTCYLCPGNKRSNGEQNPEYTDCYTFENDFPALLQEEISAETVKSSPLLQLKPE